MCISRHLWQLHTKCHVLPSPLDSQQENRPFWATNSLISWPDVPIIHSLCFIHTTTRNKTIHLVFSCEKPEEEYSEFRILLVKVQDRVFGGGLDLLMNRRLIISSVCEGNVQLETGSNSIKGSFTLWQQRHHFCEMLWYFHTTLEHVREQYKERYWYNWRQWVLAPVLDQCEHFYMVLYSLFDSCTSPASSLDQCQ